MIIKNITTQPIDLSFIPLKLQPNEQQETLDSWFDHPIFQLWYKSNSIVILTSGANDYYLYAPSSSNPIVTQLHVEKLISEHSVKETAHHSNKNDLNDNQKKSLDAATDLSRINPIASRNFVTGTINNIPAINLSSGEVTELQAGLVAGDGHFATIGDIPTDPSFPADSLSSGEVTELQAGLVAGDGHFAVLSDLEEPDYTIVNKTTDSDFDTSGVTTKTKYVGDTRAIAGHTWYNHWATGTTPSQLIAILDTTSGVGSGYVTLSKSTYTLTATASTTNPDFSLLSIAEDEVMHVVSTTGVQNLTVDSISSNSIVFTTELNVLGSGSSLTVLPQVILSGHNLTITSSQKLYFKGIKFLGVTFTNSGYLTFENCVFDNCSLISIGGETTFVGYCNSFINSELPLKVLRDGFLNGQWSVIHTTYSDPGYFKKAALNVHTGGKVRCNNCRSLWTAFGVVIEGGANVIMDNYTAFNTYRDGVVARGANTAYFTNLGVKRPTSGYCLYCENGAIFAPNAVLITGGGSTTSGGVYLTATDIE